MQQVGRIWLNCYKSYKTLKWYKDHKKEEKFNKLRNPNSDEKGEGKSYIPEPTETQSRQTVTSECSTIGGKKRWERRQVSGAGWLECAYRRGVLEFMKMVIRRLSWRTTMKREEGLGERTKMTEGCRKRETGIFWNLKAIFFKENQRQLGFGRNSLTQGTTCKC